MGEVRPYLSAPLARRRRRPLLARHCRARPYCDRGREFHVNVLQILLGRWISWFIRPVGFAETGLICDAIGSIL